MRRLLVGVTLVISLGCAGATEKLLEATTGGAVSITENGMTMQLPDGSTMVVVAGDAAVVPADFPLPSPWDGATPTTMTTITAPDGVATVAVTYELSKPKDEILAVYRSALGAHGITPDESVEEVAGIRKETVGGTMADGRYAGVAISEAYGTNTVTVTVGRREDLDRY